MRLLFALLATLALTPAAPAAEDGPATIKRLFARENLVAWCIVPFDAMRRGPEERATMLGELGFTKFAYDWRTEHLPSFDAELQALKDHDIELTGVWFPAELNAEARLLLEVLKRHEVKTQLWVAMSDTFGNAAQRSSPAEDAARANAAAEALRPVVEAAGAQGCQVGLYNHGGWFGEPENQLAILAALDAPNVGIVYNQHHGHDQVDRFAELLSTMRPRLYAINLNGMDRDGERRGRKILPLGQGELDLALLRTIAESGYRGPIGILGHTQDDAKTRLQDNLDGLDWLVRRLSGDDAGEQPTPRTPLPAAERP
jgi:sugar phosphate isomerase/epimerase